MTPSYRIKSERDMVEAALSMPYGEKVAKAVQTLRAFAPQALALSPDGYWLCQSGGKDSAVIEELARMSGVAYVSHHNLTTLDPPELIYHLRRSYPGTVVHRPDVRLLDRMVEKANGPPTRLSRWCCEEYKEAGGLGHGRIIGVRIEESARRARLWRVFVPDRKSSGFYVCPICYWTSEDVWRFIRDRNLPYCSLYDEGFSRLGCIGCPLAGAKTQRMEFARWPKYEVMWRRAVFKFWDRWHGVPLLYPRWVEVPHDVPESPQGDPCQWRTYSSRAGGGGRHTVTEWGYFTLRRWFEDLGSAQGVWEWWISGEAAKDGGGCQMEDMLL